MGAANKLYIAATPDEYELPVYIVDSLRELADKLGKSVSGVKSQVSRNNKGRHIGCIGGYRVYSVDVEKAESASGGKGKWKG